VAVFFFLGIGRSLYKVTRECGACGLNSVDGECFGFDFLYIFAMFILCFYIYIVYYIRNALILVQIYCVWFDVIIVLKSYATAKAILYILVNPFAWPFPTIKQISHSRVLILRTMPLKAKVVRVHATNLSLYICIASTA
jgi:hypothetical protein